MALPAVHYSPFSGSLPVPPAARAKRDSALRYVRQFLSGRGARGPDWPTVEAWPMDEIELVLQEATSHRAAGAAARLAGEEHKAQQHFRQALTLTVEAAERLTDSHSALRRQDALLQSVRNALECGEVVEARRLLAMAGPASGSTVATEEWSQFHDPYAWADHWLIAAVRREPPDEQALDVLADRYWKPLFGRCLLLTVNHHKASDLAQEAWCRVLRARHALNPGGNFPAYLTTVATNIWRDWHRSARRAGAMADHQMASLDAAMEGEGGNPTSLADILPDLNGLEAEQKKRLAQDIDQALEQLAPQLRDVLVSRFMAHESCAEIGRRYGRTEQSVSGWIRQALHEMKNFLEEADRGSLRKGVS